MLNRRLRVVRRLLEHGRQRVALLVVHQFGHHRLGHVVVVVLVFIFLVLEMGFWLRNSFIKYKSEGLLTYFSQIVENLILYPMSINRINRQKMDL